MQIFTTLYDHGNNVSQFLEDSEEEEELDKTRKHHNHKHHLRHEVELTISLLAVNVKVSHWDMNYIDVVPGAIKVFSSLFDHLVSIKQSRVKQTS